MPLGRRRVGRWKEEHWFVPFTFWYECPLVVLACESLHVCTVCIWRCEHARFCVEVLYTLYKNCHSFIHYEDVPLVEVMQLRSLLLYLCYVFRAIINSLVC